MLPCLIDDTLRSLVGVIPWSKPDDDVPALWQIHDKELCLVGVGIHAWWRYVLDVDMVGKATSLGFGEVQGRADKKVGLKAQSVWDLSMENVC